MESYRKRALGIGAVIACGALSLIFAPSLVRGPIVSRLKAEIGRSVDARVSWDGAGLSVLRDFPNVTLRVNRPSVVGVKPFENDTLVAMRHARLVLDIGSVIRYLTSGAAIVVREIELDQPAVTLRVLSDGTANWNIVHKPATATTGPGRAVAISLRDLQINDGSVTLDNRQSHLDLAIRGLYESLHGDFARERFVLTTRTRADTASLRFAGIPYLHRVRVELNADVDADLAAHRFTFANDTLRVNALPLAFAGSVTTGKPDIALDLRFSAPSTAFHDIVSLVPVLYAHDFEQLQTNGTMSLSGRVRGTYGTRTFPAFALEARVENGTFRYPSLPLSARDIFVKLAISNPGGHVDSTVVDIERLHAQIGGRPLDARLVMRTPVSDPDVDLRLTGTLDLADVGRTVKLDSVAELAGIIAADVATRARLSDIDAKRYERVDARGAVNVAHLVVRAAAVPHRIAIDTAALRLTPRAAELSSLTARIGNSDVRATGSLDNLLAFAFRGGELRGTATVSSRQFDLNDWRSKQKNTQVILVPPRVDFDLQASADRVLYGALTATSVRGGVRVSGQRVTIRDLRMELLRGSFAANGFYETAVAGRPTFDAAVRLDSMDIPSAFASLATVQKLAPVARWAQGSVSGMIRLAGPLDQAMVPVFSALAGSGVVETEQLVLRAMPALERLADALSLPQLRSPTLGGLRASYDLADGRIAVRPFTVNVAGMEMTVAGSHGIDQSLRYDLSLAVPRALLGHAASTAIAKLATRAGRAETDVTSAEVLRLAARVAGTVTQPTVSVDFAGTAASLRDAAQSAVRQEVEARTEAVKQKADSALGEVRRRMSAEAERIVTEAERQADTIRAQARAVAATLRQEASTRVDSLLARSTNPLTKRAAQVAADRIRREADQQAERIIREADIRADSLVAEAKRRAQALAPPPSE